MWRWRRLTYRPRCRVNVGPANTKGICPAKTAEPDEAYAGWRESGLASAHSGAFVWAITFALPFLTL